MEAAFRMEIEYLETVLAVVKYRSFTRAAEEIPCSQGSVSRQISDVEKALGYPIFNRSTRRGILGLTEEGRAVIPQIEQLVDEYNTLFRKTDVKKQTTYRLGLIAGLYNYKAKYNLVSHAFSCCPDINLVLKDVDRESWMRELTSKSIDGLVLHLLTPSSDDAQTETLSMYSGFRFTFLRKQFPSVVLPKDHRLAGRKSVSIRDLAQETFLFNYDVRNHASESRDTQAGSFLRSCEEAGFTPKIVSQDKSGIDFANVRDVSIAAHGWIYPTFQIDPWCRSENVVFVPLEDSLNCVRFYFVIPGREPTPADSRILECLEGLYRETP